MQSKYTHVIKKSNQRCFHACWWPSEDPSTGRRERQYPLMHMESGQINRVKESNLRKLK